MKKILLLFLLLLPILSSAQKARRMQYSAKFQEQNEEKYPGAIILLGEVKMKHQGITLDCKRAFYYRESNLFKALGDVIIEQGDSIIQYSDYADYNATTKKAVSWGNVEANDPNMRLKTDTLHFDRTEQKLFYNCGGTIRDKTNTLKSKKGTYNLKTKKFNAVTNVTLKTPEQYLESTHLEYYTDTKLVYLYGPSTITNLENENKIYAERGFYNTNTEVSYFVKNAKLFLKERTITADSLYYDQQKDFASATNNIRVLDTLQHFLVKGNYAELYEKKDSLFIIDKAVAISVLEKDSMYVHGDKILVTGKPEQRIVRTFKNVKIFKSNLQGKCDSLHTDQATGLTKMFRNPVLWSNKSQITGDTIHFLSNTETEKLDSLKVLNNSLIIQKDSLAENDFNQIKGRDIFGKFIDNDLKTLFVEGNAESIYYNRNETTAKLETITKEVSSSIEFTMENNEIIETKYFQTPEGKTYPPSELPTNTRKLKGFIWREDERPKTPEDIFIKTATVKKDTTLNTNSGQETRVKNPDVEKAKGMLGKENANRKKEQQKEKKAKLIE